MADRRTNFLVILMFDENLHIGNQIDTEQSFRNKITKDLQHLIKGKKIKHFVIADDEVINNKLKQEPILDKIRAEIEQAADKQHQIAIGIADLNERYTHIQMENAYRHSLGVIDKYKESEVVED